MESPFTWLHPRLAVLPPPARRAALRESNREPFDAFELVAMAAALVIAAWLLPAAPRWLTVAIAAGATIAILLRRCRRALRRMLGA